MKNQYIEVTLNHSNYSSLLAETPHAPPVLYCRGNVDLLQSERCVAVVGSRKATRYGHAVVQAGIPHLVAAGCVVVSGLAYGIDTVAHEATLDAGGYTIAVLGSPVVSGEITPQRNAGLAERILASGGLLLSENPAGSPVYASHYPLRNRIIAGLCQATVVVEGTIRSGSLITARYAVEYGRHLFTVPGEITAPLSAGPNRLLSQGAVPWLGPEHFLNEMAGVFIHGAMGDLLTGKQQNTGQTVLLSPDEKQVLALFAHEPLSINDAIEMAVRAGKLQPHQVIQCVMSMVIKGALLEVTGGRYVAAA